MKTGDGKSKWYKTMQYSSIGIEFAASIAVGAFIGGWLDHLFDTSPWLLIFWTLCGIGAGFKALLRVTKQFLKESQASEDKRSD